MTETETALHSIRKSTETLAHRCRVSMYIQATSTRKGSRSWITIESNYILISISKGHVVIRFRFIFKILILRHRKREDTFARSYTFLGSPSFPILLLLLLPFSRYLVITKFRLDLTTTTSVLKTRKKGERKRNAHSAPKIGASARYCFTTRLIKIRVITCFRRAETNRNIEVWCT